MLLSRTRLGPCHPDWKCKVCGGSMIAWREEHDDCSWQYAACDTHGTGIFHKDPPLSPEQEEAHRKHMEMVREAVKNVRFDMIYHRL